MKRVTIAQITIHNKDATLTKHSIFEALRAPGTDRGARSVETAAWCLAHRAFKLYGEAERIEKSDPIAQRILTAPVLRTDQTVGTTTTPGWASELTQNSVAAQYLAAIQPLSGAARLIGMGEPFPLEPDSSISFPIDSAALTSAPWASEGSPIKVLRGDFDAVVLGPTRKIAAIIPITRELLRRSAGRQVFNSMLRSMAAASLDLALFSSDAGDTEKHAGLRYNLTPLAGHGDVTNDVASILAELGRLGSSGRNAIVANPLDAAAVLTRLPQLAVPVIQSRAIPSGTVMGIDVAALASSVGEPELDISEHAIVHMSDEPLEIVAGTPTTSDPVRSFFQTASLGVRLLLDVAWVQRNSAIVTMESVSWT